MAKVAETQKKTTWSTWEELLLAFSVKRHGLNDWDAVAMELRSRSSLPALLTAQICREKYRDLQRRFTNHDAAVDEDDGGDVVIPWLEDLRQLRVAELKQEVHRHDLSIQSLQLTVKRLEEERERSMKDGQDMAIKPDLTEAGKEILANDTRSGRGDRSGEIAGDAVSGGNSDHENRSVNESNFAENTETGDKSKPGLVHVGDAEPDRNEKPAKEDSCKDSSNRHEASKANHGDDVSNDETKDVESSASLTKKRRKRRDAIGGEKAAALSPAIALKREDAEKSSEPLVALLDVIRSHKHGKVFKRRLQIQKTDKYKSTIRKHVDLETVQTRIDDGSYSSCPSKFYLDLLLLFTNAIVFFPKSSLESIAAHQLRSLVLKKLKTKNKNSPSPSTKPKPKQDRPSFLLAKRHSTPIVVCRKRSSMSSSSAKAADETSQNSAYEDDSSANLKTKERSVTGVRSARTSKQTNRTANKDEDRKKKGSGFSSTNKKRGAADFLKRIKKSSPAKGSLPSDSRREHMKRKKTVEKKDGATAGRSVGRPRRRERDAMLDTNDDEYSKRPKKRTKR